MQLKYKIPRNEVSVKILGSKFFDYNKDRFYLIVEGEKKTTNTEYLPLIDYLLDEKETIEIFLVEDTLITDMSYMFEETYLLEINIDSKWDCENILFIQKMFYRCNYLEYIADTFHFSSLKETNFSYLFYECYDIKSINILTDWNTANVTDMTQMFDGCIALHFIYDVSKWNTKQVTNMSQMFRGCRSLKRLSNIDKWDVQNVTNMENLFFECTLLGLLPEIGKWNTHNVTSMKSMFCECKSLLFIPDISSWVVTYV